MWTSTSTRLVTQHRAGGAIHAANFLTSSTKISGINRPCCLGCAVLCRFPQYAQSKLCNVLFTAELQRRLQGRGIVATSVSPGFVNTTIFRWGGVGCRMQQSRALGQHLLTSGILRVETKVRWYCSTCRLDPLVMFQPLIEKTVCWVLQVAAPMAREPGDSASTQHSKDTSRGREGCWAAWHYITHAAGCLHFEQQARYVRQAHAASSAVFLLVCHVVQRLMQRMCWALLQHTPVSPVSAGCRGGCVCGNEPRAERRAASAAVPARLQGNTACGKTIVAIAFDARLGLHCASAFECTGATSRA